MPGTFGNDSFWPNVLDGRATFGSELRRGVGDGAEIYPYLWAGGNNHSDRQAAAQNLAELIDAKAAGFDRVCLVGHSHGGNIALCAAGRCRTKIDSVVCLSTPHVHLETRDAAGKYIVMPVYCSWRTRRNTTTIVSICPSGDAIPEFWANVLTGLDDNVAIPLTQEWQEHSGYPRLSEDTFWGHLRGSAHVKTLHDLTVADANLSFQSYVSGGVTAQHSAAHSRRMGRVVGELIRGGFSADRLGYVNTLVQPAAQDEGDPVPETEQKSYDTDNQSLFHVAGWKLRKVTVRLDPEATRVAGDSHPDPYVLISSGDGRKLYKSPYREKTLVGTWDTGYILWAGQGDIRFSVLSDRAIRSDAYLGGRTIHADRSPPAETVSDPSHGVYWSGDLDWIPVHY